MPRTTHNAANMPLIESKQLKRRNKGTYEFPHLFGRGGRDRALICLAVNGPMAVRELGRAIRSDSHKTWNMVEYLRRTGLVVKRNRAGGRKYVALNRKLPIYRRLLRLLLAFHARWPARRIVQPSYRWDMWIDNGAITRARLDLMFFSPVRSRILLFVAAVGKTDMSTMYDMLGIGSVSALYAVNHWEREGLVETRRVGQHRIVTLNPKYRFFRELKSLLDGLIVNSDEYRTYRRIGRARMRPVLKSLFNPPDELARRRVGYRGN